MNDTYEIQFADPLSPDFAKAKARNDFKRTLIAKRTRWNIAFFVGLIACTYIAQTYYPGWTGGPNSSSNLFWSLCFFGELVIWGSHYRELQNWDRKNR